MHVREHPQFRHLHEALRAVAADYLQPWQGIIFRSAPPKWASAKHILSGQGSVVVLSDNIAMGALRVLRGRVGR